LTAEFNNRITAQRKILQLVNGGSEYAEELFGLSKNAINRWLFKNHIKSESNLVSLIYEASAKLFFLSNKSQEQISEEYKTLSSEIEVLYKLIEAEIG